MLRRFYLVGEQPVAGQIVGDEMGAWFSHFYLVTGEQLVESQTFDGIVGFLDGEKVDSFPHFYLVAGKRPVDTG